MSSASTMRVSTARGGALGAKRAVSSARALRARVDMSAAVSFTRERAAVVASATKRATSYAHTNRKGLAAFVERASAKQMKGDLIPFRVGMTLKVGVTVAEGNKTRVQPYEGVVIAIHRAGVATTVTVRKTMQGFGVERVFPVHSPLCTFEEIRGAGKPVVRRAKLFYLRKLVGKQARLKTRFVAKKDQAKK
ncbi:Ribosomal protein L19 [Ostreococcus tauri]|uniref:Ribosomal protein L19 n=1 Tax=Ostreococcus tauri TaxID=70448 RepID=A0A096P9D0_OSTTA|nr:Ribosomal protein L19 [Ostreococcus tauri]CEG00858.1 Ribosomal protein L19 [Ostreococcus tauri]|eukprot:XP_022840628.1 Ribosomal protein L19 [Ostreococcus tauri]